MLRADNVGGNHKCDNPAARRCRRHRFRRFNERGLTASGEAFANWALMPRGWPLPSYSRRSCSRFQHYYGAMVRRLEHIDIQ